MDRCPVHPDRETMILCLECGRYFCRICTPPGKAGQYCKDCYREALTEIERKRAPRPIGDNDSPAGAWSRVADAAKKRFPLVGRETEKYEGDPPLRECWYKLVAVVLSGAAVWTLVVCLTHHRRPWVSVIVAFLVAAGVVLSLGTRFGLVVGLFAMALALLSLATGEVIIQVLFRHGVIKTLDLPAVSLKVESKVDIYGRFFYNVLMLRFLPSAVVAFLVGWWPISKRIGWRGF